VLTTVKAGSYTVRGLSVGGIYTSLFVPELQTAFDVGAPARSFAACRTLLLSHGHVDHVGALPALLGIRALVGKTTPLKVLMPEEIVEPVTRMLTTVAEMQRYDLSIDAVGLRPGDEHVIDGSLRVRAFKTHHPVPSLGYTIFRRIAKLRRQFRQLPGHEIGERRRAGEDLFDYRERIELAYATDTLVDVLDREPDIKRAAVLVLECTFLDERKPVKTARAGCHIHLDELLERADDLVNEHIVLMHFSQIYKPQEVVDILDRRVPPELRSRIIPFVPRASHWPG